MIHQGLRDQGYNDSSKWPIQLVLRQYVLQGSSLAAGPEVDPNRPPPPERTIQMAVVVIATVPILLVYPFLQKYFTQGALTGVIKGSAMFGCPFRAGQFRGAGWATV